MKERLLEFLRSENKSSAQLAEEIGVQPSGISHILSGRNNPSLDFVLKMLEKYQFLSTDWLLFGKGTMYKDPQMQSLFDQENLNDLKIGTVAEDKMPKTGAIEQNSTENQLYSMESIPAASAKKTEISRIILFYADNSFEEYMPR
jgi:transcriptional regulator with XRE-family HTH domain